MPALDSELAKDDTAATALQSRAEGEQERREVTDDRQTLWVERLVLVIMVPLGYPLFLIVAWAIGLVPGQSSTITANSSIDNIAFVGLAVVSVFVLGALSLSLSNTLDLPRWLRGVVGTTSCTRSLRFRRRSLVRCSRLHHTA